MNHNEFEAFIGKQRWIFAKTYADKAPHEYCLRKECCSDAEFVEAVNFIRANGVHMNYFKYDHIYYFIGGKMYWTMGSPIEETIIINRCNNDEYNISVRWAGKK